MQNRGVIPRNNGQAPPPQPQNGTRGFVNVYNTHSIWENLYINWLGKSNGVSLTFPRDYYHQGDIRFANIEPLGTFTNK